MTSQQAAYVAGVAVADVMLAHGLPVLKVESLDAGERFGIVFGFDNGWRQHWSWPVDTSADSAERDIRRELEAGHG